MSGQDDRQSLVKLLHLIPRDGIGGVEVAAKSMLAHTRGDFDFTLLFIEPSGPIERGPKAIVSIIRENIATFRRAKIIAPDVILCSLWRSVPLALMLRLVLRRTKFVFFVHSDVTIHRLDALLSRLAIYYADEVWGDSEATLAIRDVPIDHAHVISFVTDRLVAPDRHGGRADFVSWGRLHTQKGIDRSIRLVALLVRRGIDVRYDVYGPDGGAQNDLEALATELGVTAHVRFPGPVSRGDLTAIAAQNRFFLQLSRSEGMCMAAVEAMQLGLVPVATEVGELARYVRPGETGIVVAPDRLEAAANEIERLIDDDAAWHRLSSAARNRWLKAPLYADDVCDAAQALVGRLAVK